MLRYCGSAGCDPVLKLASNVLAFNVGRVRFSACWIPRKYRRKRPLFAGKTALINKLMAKVFGTSNEREMKRLAPVVEQINALEPEMKQLTDEQLRAKTDEFRKRIHDRIDSIEDADEKAAALKEILDEILPEAFAVAREGGWRVLKMRHFDVQLIGGMVLHQGKIAEMKTGEGKTLVATLP